MIEAPIPMILTTRERDQAESAYREWRSAWPGCVRIAHDLFRLVEYAEEAFGPHVQDIAWLDAAELRRHAYGPVDPIDLLLNAMDFPPESAELANGSGVSREWVRRGVRGLIQEGMSTDLTDDYMPRSIVMGWIVLAHLHVLQGVDMATG
ncbi:MAG: hypothetical protein AAGI37_20990 [Planctomycetota bacterium]